MKTAVPPPCGMCAWNPRGCLGRIRNVARRGVDTAEASITFVMPRAPSFEVVASQAPSGDRRQRLTAVLAHLIMRRCLAAPGGLARIRRQEPVVTTPGSGCKETVAQAENHAWATGHLSRLNGGSE